MAEFNPAYRKTNVAEGRYSNNSKDKGKETYTGISRVSHPNWAGWSIIDKYKASCESIEELNKVLGADQELQRSIYLFYLQNYWDALKLSLIKEQELAELLYDVAVNMGVQRAAEFFQRAINLLNRDEAEDYYKDIKVDRSIGPRTLSAYEKARPQINRLIVIIATMRAYKYIEIMERDPEQEIFVGWFERVLDFYEEWLR